MLSYYVRDWSFYGLVKNYVDQGIDSEEAYSKVIDQMFTSDTPYLHSCAYAGNFCHDEPTYLELTKLPAQIKLYNEKMKELGATGEALVNLNPNYVLGAGLSKGWSKDVSYQDYVDYYFENVAPLTGYVSFDYYPFLTDQYDGSYLRQTYLSNLETMALRCKEGGYELRTFLQDCGDFTGTRDMTSIGDFRFQINSALAFGAKDITYYTYMSPHSDAVGEFGLVDMMSGKPNWTYALAKQANAEAHAFEDAYLHYSWVGAGYQNADPMFENQNFANLASPLEEFPDASFSSVSEDTLLSLYEDEDGNHAYFLLNFTDPYFQKNDVATLHFAGARGLLMYRLGQRMVVPLSQNGDYEFHLYPGEGRFIVPLY